MALSSRALAVLKVATIGGLALVLSSFIAERWRPDVTLVRVPEPASEPCEKQSWVNSDRACLTWTARPAGVNGPIHIILDQGARKSVGSD
jgi:hypothetical protein